MILRLNHNHGINISNGGYNLLTVIGFTTNSNDNYWLNKRNK